MKRSLFTKPLKQTLLAVPACALMLGAAQAQTTVGLNFQSWYYDSGSTPQTVGYGGGYGTTGFPVTSAAFGVPVADWFNADPMPCHAPISGPATFGGTATTFAGGLTANVSAARAWTSGIGEQVAGWHPETVAPGNNEVTWGYLDSTSSQSPTVTVSGLTAKFPHGYVIQTIAARPGASTFNAVDITDGTTTNKLSYSTRFVTGSASDGYDSGNGTAGISAPSGEFTSDTIQINAEPQTSPNHSTLAAFIITDQPVVSQSPAGVTNLIGSTISLSAGVVAHPNGLHYQWQKNGSDMQGANSATYTKIGATTGDSGGYDLVVTNLYGAATNAPVTVLIVPTDLWVGNVNGTWDIAGAANWLNGVATTYTDGDNVTFDDTAITTSVNVATTVSPVAITVTNDTKSYVISGSPIAGSASLTKSGANALTLSGADTFTGNIAINAGTLTIAGPGQLGGGMYPGKIVNNGSFVYNSTADQTLSGAISGTGSLTQNGNSTLTLSGANTFSGAVTANSGKLTIGTGGKLGNASSITINNGATVQFSGNANSDSIGNGSMPITVNAGGTLAVTTGNSMGYDYLYNYANITLNNGTFSLSAVQYIGTLTLNGGTVDGASALQFWYSVPTAINCLSNATISSGLNVNNSPQTISVAGGATLTISGVIASSALTKTGSGTLAVSGVNTYSGTTVSNGTFMVASGGALGTGAVTVMANATLFSEGTIAGPTTILAGGTVGIDATNIGTLTLTGTLTLAAGSTNYMKISKTGGSASSDQITSMTSATLGGTLIVTNITSNGTLLAVGDAFKLFSTGAFYLNFDNVILPTLPTGLSWDISGLATSGTIAVVNSAAPPAFNPPPGSALVGTTVTISSLTPGATIYYTTNGSTPTTSSPHGVTPVSVTVLVNTTTEILMAYASASGYPDSGMVSAVYNLSAAVWTNTAGGLWSDSGNWLYNVLANGAGFTADFSSLKLSADTTVTVDAPATVGNLVFADRGNAHNWILADGGAGPLTLDAGVNTPVITVSNQTTTIGAVLAGTSGFTKTGAGELDIASQNSYTGTTTVNAGTLNFLTNANTYRDTPLVIAAGAVVSSSATLNLNVSQNGNGPSVNVSGAGMLRLTATNNSASSPDLFFGTDQVANDYWGVSESAPLDLGSRQRFVYGLTGHNGVGEYGLTSADAQFGGSISGSGGLTFIAQNTWNGSPTMEVPFCLLASNNFTGPVELQRGSVYLGNANALTQTNVLFLNASGTNNARFFLYGNSVAVANLSSSSGGTNVIANGNKLTGAALTLAAATLTINQNTPGTFSGSIQDVQPEYDGSGVGTTGPLGLTKAGPGALTLSGANNYSGPTTVNAGTLLVNGSIGTGTTTVASGATLGGAGTLNGAVTVNGILTTTTGGLGTLTIANALTLAAGSTTTLAIDRTSGTATYGQVAGLTSVVFGGTLTVTSVGGTFQNGDTFTLFNAGSYTGNFTANNLPALGSGLAWNWNPADGVLSVVNAGAIPPSITGSSTITGGNFQMTFTGPSGSGYSVRASTDLTLAPVTSWPVVGTGTFSEAPVIWQDINATNYSKRFYRITIP